jgi:hypothetical protein
VVEYQEVLSRVDWEDFEVAGAGQRASKVVFGSGKQETKIGRVREETLVSNSMLVLGGLSAVAAGAAWIWRSRVGKRVTVR